MVYYLIVCRSLTHAQRTERALTRAGISARILRSPRVIDGEGCSHSVRIKQRDLTAALAVLAGAGLSPKRIFAPDEESGYKEVLF